jgi:CHASE2 domain-containing sensor protein
MKTAAIDKLMPFIIAAAFLAVVFGLSYLQVFEHYELNALDLRFALRPPLKTSQDVVLIEISEDTIKNLGRFPFDRSYHAILIKALREFGAKAVMFDLFFSETSKDDKDMEDAMIEAKNVYLPYVFDLESAYGSLKRSGGVPAASGYMAKCLDSFTALAKDTGHINVIPDRDGKYRRAPVYIKYESKLYPYISFEMACDYLGINKEDISIAPGRFIQCGDKLKVPLDERSNMLINFSGKWGTTYHHYSYFDVLKAYLEKALGNKPVIDPDSFKGKVCIVGLTATGTSDTHPNPFDPLYPAVGMHAEMFNSMVTGNFITRLSRGANLAVLAILMALIASVTVSTKPVQGFSMLIMTAALFAISSVFLFIFFRLWIDVVYPVVIMAVTYVTITLYKYVTEWKKRLVLENELDIAKKIQLSFLPKTLPAVKGTELAATMFTARQVGGDLYDFIVFGEDKLGVMVGDVSGKGVPASLFMAMASGSFKFFANESARPEDVLAKLNSKIVKESTSNLFITMFYAMFDMRKMVLSYGNGGHLPLLYLPASGKIRFLDVDEGTPLGLMEGGYSGKETSFGPGDAFVFYTDGITEAMNTKGEMYEKNRLSAAVEKNRHASAQALLAAIEKDVRRFEPRSQQHDDITILVVKIKE